MTDFKPIGGQVNEQPIVQSAGISSGSNNGQSEVRSKKSSTLGDLIMRIGEKIRFKSLFVLAIILFIVLSDVFIEYILGWISNDAVEQGQTTTKGTFIQILIIIILYAFVDMLASTNIL